MTTPQQAPRAAAGAPRRWPPVPGRAARVASRGAAPERGRAAALAGVAVLLLTACYPHVFSGVDFPERTRPVVRIETRGGVEQGAATTEGVLLLGRTARSGPCRLHYFLAGTPMVDDGTIVPAGGILCRVDHDLKQQSVPLLERPLRSDDVLAVLVHRGIDVERIDVRLAQGESVRGDLLEWPGRTPPPGSGLFQVDPENGSYRFVGLIAGEASLEDQGRSERYLVFAGLRPLLESLATPEPFPPAVTSKHRPDDITVVKRGKEIVR